MSTESNELLAHNKTQAGIVRIFAELEKNKKCCVPACPCKADCRTWCNGHRQALPVN